MTTRTDAVLDAAIEVLADGGLRRLTHRAVDHHAGLPAGATSNVFRSRADLVSGVLGRIVGTELALWDAEVAGTAARGGIDGFSAAITALVTRLTKEHRSLTAARQAVVADPETMAGARGAHGDALAQIHARLGPELRALGLRVEGDAALVLALLEGLILATLTASGDAPDVRRAVGALLRGLA